MEFPILLMKAIKLQNSMNILFFLFYRKERFQNFFNDLDTFLEIDDESELRTRAANLRKNVSTTKSHYVTKIQDCECDMFEHRSKPRSNLKMTKLTSMTNGVKAK